MSGSFSARVVENASDFGRSVQSITPSLGDRQASLLEFVYLTCGNHGDY